MATDLERMVIVLEANVTKLDNAMKRAAGQFDRSVGQMEKRVTDFQKSIDKVNFGSLNSALQAIGLTGTAMGLKELSDDWTQFKNRLVAVGVPLNEVTARLQLVNEIANRSRQDLGGVVDLYSKMTLATQSLNYSQLEVAKATETVSKAMSLSGASVLEAKSTITQLSQALSSGFLQGDELRALRENAPLVAQALAKEFGTTVGGLKKLGAEGAITADRLMKAILASNADIEASFAKTTATIGQAGSVLRNAFTEFIGTSGEASAAAKTIAETLIFLSKNVEELAAVLQTLAIAWLAIFSGSVLGKTGAYLISAVTPLVALVTAMGSAAGRAKIMADAMRLLNTSTATLGVTIARLVPMFAAISVAGYLLSKAFGDIDSASKNAKEGLENVNSLLAESTDLFKQSGDAARKLAQDDIEVLVKQYGNLTEAQRLNFEQQKRVNQLQANQKLGQAVTQLINIDPDLANIAKLETKLESLRKKASASSASKNLLAGEIGGIEKQLENLRLKINIDPRSFTEAKNFAAQIKDAIESQDYGLAEKILSDFIASKFFDKLNVEFQKGALQLKDQLTGLTGSDVNIRFNEKGVTDFKNLLTTVEGKAVDLKFVLENIKDFKFGDIGAREFFQAQSALEGSVIESKNLKQQLSDAAKQSSLIDFSGKGDSQKQLVVDLQTLTQRLVDGKITANEFTKSLSALGAKDKAFAGLTSNIGSTAAKLVEAETLAKRLEKVISLAPAGGPSKAVTERKAELSVYDRELRSLQATSEEAQAKTAVLQRLGKAQGGYNKELEAELIFLESKKRIEKERGTGLTGGEQSALREQAAKQALARQEEFLTQSRLNANRAIIEEARLQDLLIKAYSSLNPELEDYTKQKEIQLRYAQLLSQRLNEVGEAAYAESDAIMTAAKAYVDKNTAMQQTIAQQDLIANSNLAAKTIAAQGVAYAQLNPYVKDYALQAEAAGIAAQKIGEYMSKTNGVIDIATIREIQHRSAIEARLKVQQDAARAYTDFLNAQNRAAQLGQAELDILRELNPLTSDYELKKRILLETERQVQDLQNRGLEVSQEQRDEIQRVITATETYRNQIDRLTQVHEELRNVSRDALRGLITDMARGKSASEALAGALQRVADKLLDIALSSVFDGGIGSFGDAIGNVFGSIFGRAVGGTVSSGRPYMVGESGRELFVPNQKGTIIPLDKLGAGGGGGGNTVVNVNNYSGQNVTQTSRQQGNTEIIEIVVGEVQKRMTRGGFDKQLNDRYRIGPSTIGR